VLRLEGRAGNDRNGLWNVEQHLRPLGRRDDDVLIVGLNLILRVLLLRRRRLAGLGYGRSRHHETRTRKKQSNRALNIHP